MKKHSTLLAVLFCVSSSLAASAALACGDKACAHDRAKHGKHARKIKCSKCAEHEKAETKAEAKPEVAPEAAQPAKG